MNRDEKMEKLVEQMHQRARARTALEDLVPNLVPGMPLGDALALIVTEIERLRLLAYGAPNEQSG